jgi:uncharacterized protein YjbI with pentapeptide repeats
MASWQDQFVQSEHHGLFLPRTSCVQHTSSSSSAVCPLPRGQEDQSHKPRPSADDTKRWKAYWRNKGQPWRTEPLIDPQRQEELAKRRAIVPDVKKGIYPFRGMKLSRADVEWLLATHENGQGPVDWTDQSQRDRKGLDLRGADLSQEDLSDLPLARMLGGLPPKWKRRDEKQRNMAAVYMQKADLRRTQLQGAELDFAQLQKVDLRRAQLQKANLLGAQLQAANLQEVQLQEATLLWAKMEEANLHGAQLQKARLGGTNLRGASLHSAQLQGVFLHLAQLDGVDLRGATLADETYEPPRLADVRWGEINLSVVDWTSVKALGDEYFAHKTKNIHNYQAAVRANRQLAVTLQAQGLNEDAARFAYRAQVLQTTVYWFQMIQDGLSLRQRMRALGSCLFSWFLFLLAGYGYKPLRSFLAYLLVIAGFATIYYLLGLHDLVGPHHLPGPHYLSWYEAVVVSMTAFHGRGFFVGTFSPGDPQALVAAIEAFLGLLIEVTFIATLTQRLFSR